MSIQLRPYVKRDELGTIERLQQAWERKVGDLPVSAVLQQQLGFKCPKCGIIHPGLIYSHANHRQFCSTGCYRDRNRLPSVKERT